MSEPRRRSRWRTMLVVGLALLALTGGGALSQRVTLQSWYYAYRLERAAEADRQAWADKLNGMDEAAVPRWLGFFRKDDPALCTLARTSLEKKLAEWGAKDDRATRTSDRFFEAHPSFSPNGQAAALLLIPDLLPAGGAEAAAKVRTIVSAALKDRSAELRVSGIAAALRSELNLLSSVVPLLDDSEVEVRRAAMLALGPIRDGQHDTPILQPDQMIRWLHDPDPEVRRICESSLRSRGMRDRDVRFGRMLSSPDSMDRLRLLIELPDEEDLDIAKWLNHLSKDPDSAMRAGAARVAAERRVEFAERLDEMKQSDPDGTVAESRTITESCIRNEFSEPDAK